MTSKDDLIAAIRTILATSGTPYSSTFEAHDAYEGYLFALVASVGRKCGATVGYVAVAGESTRKLVFRTAPGMLYSTTHPYTHAELQFPGAPALEVHLGVRVQGTSRVLHECDVLVLPKDEADRSRISRVAPRGSKAVLAIECKFYAAHLQLNVARGFEGLHADLGLRHTLFVSNLPAPRVATYLSHRRCSWEQRVRPGSPQVNHLESLIREAFKNHCAKHGLVLP
ncbi:hypothetical protein ACLQ3B_04655 [Micromonospora sp. DT53]|uniref:hypothetical protein n=1 Tax=Micromonospora sp. DT53 TaxID=3393444 RepID=UPI003CF15FBB